ncbi:MAG TPA: imidazolonepropionase [Frankiaceae bacterium]|nr:imidazolonepropionase [Frankiaceae bacterium]
MTDLLVRGIGRLLPMTAPPVPSAAVVIRGGSVAWVGPEADLPAGLGDGPELAELAELDAGGACVVPGFVDPHTHAVWAGSRRADFEQRLAGVPYGDILGRGGGIHSTVRATRAASYDDLLALTTERLAAMRATGTTTVEMKSGYGLTPDDELRLLDVAVAAGAGEVTYLGAHAVPPDRDRDAYVAEVVATLPAARERGAAWCDVFCDEGAFTVDEARRVLTAARAAGLGLRLHADQLARIGATELAAETGCASADHLDHLAPEGARALAAAGVVAVLLPACALTMRHGRWDAARHLRDAGATIALGTDCNPGTSWCESMPYVIQLGCLAYGLSVEEAFRAATLGAAAALRRTDIGHLAVGARGDLAVLNADHEADLVAHLSAVPVRHTVVGGTVC